MEMSNLMTKLRAFKLELSDDIFVHLILISLPSQFTQYVQEEDTLKQERIESAHLTSTSGTNVVSHKQKNSKIKEIADKGTVEPKDQKPYLYCKKLDYMKKECPKYAAWREKKGLPKESSAN
ncbi:hypothetical protein R3W88_014881 [Solanum pinnatisectum]|uniref:Uncharacterized protein n=1 Tax=Solanum pinnatisectum TaxID=50273 RepID=A0AAV9KTA5_9SOLN|nr:hypothetical protein R3W88_014881 [Solanum pinnatisectum]